MVATDIEMKTIKPLTLSALSLIIYPIRLRPIATINNLSPNDQLRRVSSSEELRGPWSQYNHKYEQVLGRGPRWGPEVPVSVNIRQWNN